MLFPPSGSLLPKLRPALRPPRVRFYGGGRVRAASSRLVGVEHRVAGFAEVRESDLHAKLGVRSWHVWQVLCARRDRQGFTHVTVNGIAKAEGFVEMSCANVRAALPRLLDAALVENVGYQSRRVACGAGFGYRKVFVRRVLGARLLSVVGEDGRCAVPQETKEWMAMAKTWGGKRDRSGRKGTAARASGGDQRHLKNAPEEAAAGFSSVAGTVSSVAGTPGFQVSLSNSTYVQGTRALVRSGSSFQGKKNAPGGAQVVPLLRDGEEVGLSGGAIVTPAQLATPLRGVPPYPGNAIVSPAVTPDPPKLVSTDPEEYRVKLLAMAYQGAVEKLYGKRVFTLAKTSPRHRHWRSLVLAAEALERYDVTPAAWFTWVVRKWYAIKTHTNGWKEGQPVALPPIGYVLSLKRLEERLDDEEKRYVVTDSALGGRLVFGKVHKKLLVRYGEMRAALNANPAERAQVVERFFPGSSYEDMVDAAKREAIEIRQRMEDDAARGRMIWG